MDQLVNPCRSTIQYLPEEQQPMYETVLNEIQEWKMLHPSIIGLICGQYPNNRAKRTSIYINILANGAGQTISFNPPSTKRSAEEYAPSNKKTFKSNWKEQASKYTNKEKIHGEWPVLNGYLLIGASNMRRMAQFQLFYQKDETLNQIGSCVGGWKITNMIEKILAIADIEKIVVMAGTNDIINNCGQESLNGLLQELSNAIGTNSHIKEAIMVQPPPLPYHSQTFNAQVQQIPTTLEKLAKTNKKMTVVYTWDSFTEDTDKYKEELFTLPGGRFSTSIHLNRPGTIVLKRLLTKATTAVDMDLTS